MPSHPYPATTSAPPRAQFGCSGAPIPADSCSSRTPPKGPTLAVRLDCESCIEAQIRRRQHVIFLVTGPVSDEHEAHHATSSKLVPERVHDLDPELGWLAIDVRPHVLPAPLHRQFRRLLPRLPQ